MDPTTSNYQKASELFPNSDDFSKLKLYNLMLALEKLARPSLQFQYYLSIFGIFLTILHLVILTRKGMMMSSIIAIMVGIGICDLVAMIATIQSVDFFFDEEGTDCTPPISYFIYKSSWFCVVIRDFVRRSSTWLAVMMALIRFVFIKFGASLKFQKCSKPVFGFHMIGVCFIFSALLSSFYYFRYDIVENGIWTPRDYCSNVPSNSQYTIHTQKRSYLFTMNSEFFGKSYMLINGIISKIIPCILLPLLTFLLVLELRRAEKVRKTSNFTKRSENNGTEKTTGLVIFMTASFFVLELPIGISWCFQVDYTDFGFLYLATYLNHLCNSIFIINATFHGIVCFMMSSQYRATVWKILRLNKDQPATSNSTQLSRVEKI